MLGNGETQVVLNEIMASNTHTAPDEFGEYDDWLELYNLGSTDIDLSNYFLTDDPLELKKWRFPGTTDRVIAPANGFVLVWADEQTAQGANHTSFKLNRAGEWLALVKPDGATVVDSVTFAEQQPDISFGRSPDGFSQWIQFTEPTPGSHNPDNTLGPALPPQFSLKAGVYPSPRMLSLTSSMENSHIIYTGDGSIPHPDSIGANTFVYTSPLPLDSTCVIRARVYAENYQPSSVVSAAYFIRPFHYLPIISVVIDPDDLFDEERGIYVNPTESGREWERECHIFFFEDDYSGFEIPAGIRLQGNSGRVMDKKSFRLYFRDGYGQNQLDYPLFANTEIHSFSNLILRAGYDDDLQKTRGTLLRDPVITELYRQLEQPISHSRYVVLYLNQQFWGIYDLREDINPLFFENYLDMQDTDIIRLRWGREAWEIDQGDDLEWRDLLSFIRNQSFENNAAFAQLSQRFDVDGFTTLLALAHAVQYRSWVYGTFFVRERRADAKWRLAVWDMDRALSDLSWNGFNYYERPNNEYWIYFIAQKMLENADYRAFFINRLMDLLNTTFSSDHSVAVVDSIAQVLAPEIDRDAKRWMPNPYDWQDNVDFVRSFLTEIPDSVRLQMRNFFKLQPPVSLTLNAPSGQGKLVVNTVMLEETPLTAWYYPDVPIRVLAVPAAGFLFSHWSDPSLPSNQELLLFPRQGMVLTPIFMPLQDHIVINEIMNLPGDAWGCGDWIEFYNQGDSPVDVSNWRLVDSDPASQFIFPKNAVLPPQTFLVAVQNKASFSAYYHLTPQIIGDFLFALDKKDVIQLYDDQNRLVDEVRYSTSSPWPDKPAGEAATIALASPQLDNSLGSSWGINLNHGTPGTANQVVEVPRSPENALSHFSLNSNYPNPFNAVTTISFSLAKPAYTVVTIFDLRGRAVQVLAAKHMESGEYRLRWDAENLPSGLYFVHLEALGHSLTHKLVLQK